MKRPILCLAGVLVISCGDGTDAEPGDPAAPSTSSYNGQCCLNGQYHICDTKQAFDRCAGFDVLACHDACDFGDVSCHQGCDSKAQSAAHDPSQCTRRADLDAKCGSTPGTPSTPTGCVGTSNGMACSYSTQCPKGYHCAQGRCYADGINNPCSYSTQCTTSNCTKGCCRGRFKGSPCTYSTQCDSGNCTNGICQ